MKKILVLLALLISSDLYAQGRYTLCEGYYPSTGLDLGISNNTQSGSQLYTGIVLGARSCAGAITGPFLDVGAGSYGYSTTGGILIDSVFKLKVSKFIPTEDGITENPYKPSTSYTLGLHLLFIGFDVGQLVQETSNGQKTVPMVGINLGI